MLIFVRERLVFFATPKTASTSIEMALGTSAEIRISKMPNAKHTPFRKYKRLLEPFVETLATGEMDTVAVIREPVSWLGSWYRYRSRDELKGSPNSTADITFDKFVSGYMSKNKPDYARVGSQAIFMSDKDGDLGMSHLFRYDDIDALVSFLENRLKKKITLGRSNTSPKAELTLDPKILIDLREYCAKDFELYERLLPESK